MTNTSPPPLLASQDPAPRRVAVLRASRIGDFICATPFLRLLRRTLPQAEITLITLPMLCPAAARLDSLDRVAGFPGFPGLAEQLFEPRRALAFLRRMQARRFDLAIQLQGSGVYANPFTLLLGARRTAGFVRPGDPPGRLDAALPLPDAGHEVQRVLAMADLLGLPRPAGPPPPTEFPLWPQDHAAAAALLEGAARPLIGLHPAARDATRRWSPARFAAAAGELQRRCGGTLVGLGEAAEAPLVERILQDARAPQRSLAGKTSLPALGAVIQRLDLLLTNDSGPAHIAYALGAPTVTIFGGGDPRRYGPPAPGPFRTPAAPAECRPCGYARCPVGDACLQAISVEQVVEAALQLL
ncbi:MAG: glycosyltransferase family 9 protein [Chloroflexota bacterium]